MKSRMYEALLHFWLRRNFTQFHKPSARGQLQARFYVFDWRKISVSVRFFDNLENIVLHYNFFSPENEHPPEQEILCFGSLEVKNADFSFNGT